MHSQMNLRKRFWWACSLLVAGLLIWGLPHLLEDAVDSSYASEREENNWYEP